MQAPRRKIASVALFTGLVLAAVAIWGRHYVVPKRFAEVVPGHLYRSGQLERWPLQRVIDQYHIRTILSLLRYIPDDARQEREEAIAAEKKVRLIQIGMGGDGVAGFDDYERAAAVLADGSTHPVLVHCSAGVNRTGAVYAVWRMKYCGWDLQRALAEAEHYGYNPKGNPKLRDCLRKYYVARILTSRPATVTTRPAVRLPASSPPR